MPHPAIFRVRFLLLFIPAASSPTLPTARTSYQSPLAPLPIPVTTPATSPLRSSPADRAAAHVFPATPSPPPQSPPPSFPFPAFPCNSAFPLNPPHPPPPSPLPPPSPHFSPSPLPP